MTTNWSHSTQSRIGLTRTSSTLAPAGAHESVAQLAEQGTFNPMVARSSRAGFTTLDIPRTLPLEGGRRNDHHGDRRYPVAHP
jgi:hypothetical protein